MTRGYGQFCGLARALELVGGRWTLLIVRDLLIGPKRFTELQDGLPGIPTNILSSRLKELEEAGLVERTLLARPARSVAYRLTSNGLELEDAVMGLGRWGTKSLGRPDESDFFNVSSLAIALRAGFQPERATGPDLLFEIRMDGQRLRVLVSGAGVSFPAESDDAEPDVVIHSAPEVFAQVLTGHTGFDPAVADGRVQIDGSKQTARRFFKLFRLPSPVDASH